MSRVYCPRELPASWAEHERRMALAVRAEAAMRSDEPPPAANHPPLRSIAVARVRIEIDRFYAAHGRRHPQSNEPPMRHSAGLGLAKESS